MEETPAPATICEPGSGPSHDIGEKAGGGTAKNWCRS
eukprot:CAMPEP_0115654562 /NCGR_PEP_ID=MMETSP0272-20121206/43178_1 /TAXON_ID=71861 /ORGANISM="Scrippsiella trochoidea, Strain CCMP3099" /LENGTH=36 /DNA_ID= /DNA_START= /DNA_END= /DNA_ORIENTATION=